MLYIDRDPINQPQGTARFKLNVTRSGGEQTDDSDVSEYGNRGIFPSSEPEIGTIAIDATTTIVFKGQGKIYLQERSKFTLLKDYPCLNFNKEYPITGEFKVVRGCERTIYWVDGNNPDRYLNLDKLDQFGTCNDMNIVPDISHPDISVTVTQSGGKLEYGSYRFVVELLDSGKNVLLRTLPTTPVFIGNALNIDTFSADIGGKSPTTNSILLNFSNINLRGKYMRIFAISATSGSGVTYNAVQVGQDIVIQGRNLSYRYTGFNPSNGDTSVDIREVLKDLTVFPTSLDIGQSNNRLIRFNVKDGVHNYGLFQRYASKISSKYVVRKVNPGPDIKSEQGDEIKAYGIVYVFANGMRSPVFHIPGGKPTVNDRRLIKSRFGPGESVDKPTKTITLRLDVSTKDSPGKDRDVFINYNVSVPVQEIKFTLATGSDVQVVTSSQRNALVKKEVQGRKAAISLKIEITDKDGGKYSRVVQFSDKIENTTLKLETTTENLYSEEELEYWQVYNTSSKESFTGGGYDSSGSLGVYESDQTYDRPVNYCGDDSYWGTDYQGNNLEGTKVRYHRMPCRSTEPLLEDGQVRSIGVEFGNVEYPSDDIIGHFFVSSSYAEGNRTILTSGYMVPYNYLDDSGADSKDDTGRYLHYMPNSYDNARPTNTVNQNFIHLPFLIDHRTDYGRFVKMTGYVNTDYSDNRPLYKKFFQGRENNLQLFGKHHTVTDFVPAEKYSLVSNSQILFSKTLNGDIPNRSLTSDFHLLTLFQEPELFNKERANLNYTYLKSGIAPFPFHEQIQYRMLGGEVYDNGNPTESYVIFDGDVYLSRVDITNISKIFGDNIKSLLPLLVVGPLGLLLDKEQVNVEYELIEGLVFESIYNYNRRFEGTDTCSIYYNPLRPIDDLIARRIADRVEIDGLKDWVLRDSVCPEWYGNNSDYNVSSVKDYYPPVQVYDFCSKCINHYPGRILFSDPSTTEENIDNFLVFKPLNYVDLSTQGGEIIKGDVVGGILLVRTKNRTYKLFPNSQELQVGDAAVQLGTGSFLATPAQEFTGTTSGFAGQQYKISSVQTPFGVVWVDQVQGQVFHFDGKNIDTLSSNGMFWFFEVNLKLAQESNVTKSVKIAYDPASKMVVLSAPIFKYLLDQPLTTIDGTYKVDGKEVQLSQVGYFENRSFTLSYSFKGGYWQSFHSYMPDFMYNDGLTMYTSISTGIFAHDATKSFATYYGKVYPVVVEVNYPSLQSFKHAAFHYYADFEEYDEREGVWRPVKQNFTQAWIRSNNQSSGLVELITPDNSLSRVEWSTRRKTIETKDKNSRISKLRDIATAVPTSTQEWTQRQSYYDSGQGYMDIVPTNVDYEKHQHEQSLFVDKVLALRLFYQSFNGKVRMIYKSGLLVNTPSNR